MIVAVLWILVALSSLAMIFSVYLSVSAHALAVGDTALQTEALVSASLELTAYQLALAGEKRPSHGSFHFRMDDADVEVGFLSEAARIDLEFRAEGRAGGSVRQRSAPARRPPRTMPTGSSDGEPVRFRAPPMTRKRIYAAAGLTYAPRQSLFVHVNELALVAGLPPALVERALPFVTVFNGSSDVDAAIAAPEVLAALPSMDFERAEGCVRRWAGLIRLTRPRTKARPLRPAMRRRRKASAIGSRPRSVSAAVAATSSEVVIALGDKVEPYRVLSWQDDVEPRSSAPARRRL